ncbi:TVP38/TMEM64 family protein [Rhodobacter sp. NTK016B]|uniref:TVP38/TMEM64 family protein n=1 Tax=Rhodobacterales TaxID=204455 RepID=UPI000F8CDAEA|nr:VTT domain-containing protein [Pararhodobacter zhoushanensis]MBN8291855.1 TVP38/TMEM64 family protein [Rhodobacter sp. NTK016B]
MTLRAIILVALAILGIVLLGVWQFAPSVFAEARGLMDGERLRTLVARAGLWGPVLIVTLMTLAVVASPIPSAPIALAAGAAYGHIWGTALVVIGAELGALIAFALARILGHDVLRRVFGDRVDVGLLGSQTALTTTVFASRLMPFVSFDMISYAAGLSRLHAWRFAFATLAGIVPASFLLAHFGGEAVSGDLGQATWAVLGLGLVTGLPLLWIATRRQEKEEP